MTITTTHHNHALWPEQLRLPGQAAAHPGPVDMSMMYLMHHAFRRDLRAFAQAAAATPADDRVTWRALGARWTTFATALHHHHSGEDAGLWPALVARTDDSGRATLEAMEAEHAAIDPLLEACAESFERLTRHADEDCRVALAVRLAAARDSLGRHLEHEEVDAIAIIQEVLTAEDWAAIEREHFGKDVRPSDVVELLPWLFHEVPGPVRREVFRRAGRAHRLLWMATRPRFERRERIAFRHLR